MLVRQVRHTESMLDTALVQLWQKRACPHGTKANPSRCAIRQTSQQPDSSDAYTELPLEVDMRQIGFNWISVDKQKHFPDLRFLVRYCQVLHFPCPRLILFHELTTVTVSYMALQPAPSWSCDVCRTELPASYETLLFTLYWPLMQQRIKYKTAVLTSQFFHTGVLYLSVRPLHRVRLLVALLLLQPFIISDFACHEYVPSIIYSTHIEVLKVKNEVTWPQPYISSQMLFFLEIPCDLYWFRMVPLAWSCDG